MTTEEDRLIAALQGNKIAQTDGKFWHLIEKTKRAGGGHRNKETERIRDALRDRLISGKK
jgi:hypothetical protein